uniref:Sarcosine oxidase, beta subunit family protein n=1 Tax=uncultured organism TaxID=155900 RepID=M1QC54_9ZZZZ|nr:sarcosine oxidase, beta subunit family protein [uncultured organism]
MKKQANIVIIGGGVIGASIAYNLAEKGMQDIVVLEKNYIASGSTGSCGAGIRQQWGTKMNCLLSRKSMEIFENMNEILDTKRDIELKQGGYLLLAFSQKELDQFKENIKLQHKYDIPSQLLTVQEALDIVPQLNTEGITGAAFCPTDGHANPFRVNQAYVEAAERKGVKFYTYTEAKDIAVKNGKIKKVVTDKGEIATNRVVNAAGGFSKEVGQMAGIDIPTKSERHEILVTEQVNPILKPMVMSFSYNIYCQQTPDGSFVMGYGDPNEPASHNIKASWQFLEEMSKKATNLLPFLKKVRVIRQWAGLYNVTPDAQPILDESDDVEGYYMAVGFSGHGFMIAPMTGILMAEMITGEELSIDIELDLERFDHGRLILEPSVV